MNKQLHHDSILAVAQVERVQVLGPRWREAIEQPEAMDGPRAFAGTENLEHDVKVYEVHNTAVQVDHEVNLPILGHISV